MRQGGAHTHRAYLLTTTSHRKVRITFNSSTCRVILVDNKDDADVLLSFAAWTNEEATLGAGETMWKNPDWSRVVIIDEIDHFESATHGYIHVVCFCATRH